MCVCSYKYCTIGSKQINRKIEIISNVDFEENKLTFKKITELSSDVLGSLKIEFCPFCGRELNAR